MVRSPADSQASRQRKISWIFKIHTTVGPNHSAEIDALKSKECWEWRKTSFIRGEKDVTARFSLVPLPLSVTPSYSLTQPVSLYLSFMMRQHSEIRKNTETWSLLLNNFFLPIFHVSQYYFWKMQEDQEYY